jgi:hypothetical protein
MNIRQDKIDELMRLLKRARELIPDTIDDPEYDAFENLSLEQQEAAIEADDAPATYADRENEATMLAIGRAGIAIRDAIEHLTPVALEPGLPDPGPDTLPKHLPPPRRPWQE